MSSSYIALQNQPVSRLNLLGFGHRSRTGPRNAAKECAEKGGASPCRGRTWGSIAATMTEVAITDVERELRWSAGVPRIFGSGSVRKGRVILYASEKTWAFDQDGRFRPVVDFRFDSEDARSAVVDIGKRLGLRYRMNTRARVGLAFALVAIVGLVLGGVVVAVLAAKGAL